MRFVNKGGRLSYGSDECAGGLVILELVVPSFKGVATLPLLSPGYYRSLIIEVVCKISSSMLVKVLGKLIIEVVCKISSSMLVKVLGKQIDLLDTRIRSINLVWSLLFFLFY